MIGLLEICLLAEIGKCHLFGVVVDKLAAAIMHLQHAVKFHVVVHDSSLKQSVHLRNVLRCTAVDQQNLRNKPIISTPLFFLRPLTLRDGSNQLGNRVIFDA